MGKRRIKTVLTYILLVLWGLIVLFPFYWMVLTSLKSYSSYNSEYIPKYCRLHSRITPTCLPRFPWGDTC